MKFESIKKATRIKDGKREMKFCRQDNKTESEWFWLELINDKARFADYCEEIKTANCLAHTLCVTIDKLQDAFGMILNEGLAKEMKKLCNQNERLLNMLYKTSKGIYSADEYCQKTANAEVVHDMVVALSTYCEDEITPKGERKQNFRVTQLGQKFNDLFPTSYLDRERDEYYKAVREEICKRLGVENLDVEIESLKFVRYMQADWRTSEDVIAFGTKTLENVDKIIGEERPAKQDKQRVFNSFEDLKKLI